LYDETGNRRFRIIEVDKIELDDSYAEPYFIQQLYAEAKVIWDSGERVWYTKEENAQIEQLITNQYVVESEVMRVADLCKNGEDVMGIFDIFEAYNTNHKFTKADASTLKNILIRRGHEYKSRRRKGGNPIKGFSFDRVYIERNSGKNRSSFFG
jgi:predicted P-loop ATPase